jgi:hypothetical protein
MSDFIKTKTIHSVLIQENGWIRNSKGYIIGRLTDRVSFDSEHINEDDGTADCMKHLSKAINSDDEYAYGWHSNIAMSCVDSIVKASETVAFNSFSDYHAAGNEAASRFMKICFDATTSLHMLSNKEE